MVNGCFANAATRNVDNALRRHVIRRIYDKREIRHKILDFGTLEELYATYNAVRNARTQQHILQRARLGVCAVQNGNVIVARTCAYLLFNLAGNPHAFIAAVRRHVNLNLVTFVLRREQALFLAFLVMRNNGVRSFQNVAHAAIILFEFHYFAVGIIVFELKDVANIRTAP